VSRDLLNLVGPILVALVTLVGAWGKETAQRRSEEQVRERIRSQAKDEISTIEAWAKAHASLGETGEPLTAIRDRARHDLDRAYDRMMQLASARAPRPTLRSVLSRLLLRHLPARPAVRLFRGLYYFTLACAPFWGLIGFTQPTSWTDASAIAGSFMAFFILAVLPAWAFARIAVIAARRHEHRAARADDDVVNATRLTPVVEKTPRHTV
jgi:hypothetical protein